MITQIINGYLVAKRIKNEIYEKISKFIRLGKRNPGLAILSVGNESASEIYMKNKILACEQVGIRTFNYHFKVLNEKKIIKLIYELNKNHKIDGILLQLPLPKEINQINIIKYIDPIKDIDGLHPYNIGKFCCGISNLSSCVSLGIMQLIEHYKINIYKMNSVIVGNSYLIGKPMIFNLLKKKSTVTIVHSFTKNIKFYSKNADLLIVAVGKEKIISDVHIKKNSILFDVGINKSKDGKISGDIDYKSVIGKASYITPVPGGVGPMTIAMLIRNVYLIYKKNQKK